MFYYPAVLKRDSGCFSTIWLAATRGITVPRREFLKVNVKRTCDDIISYILVQVPPPQPNLPRPRFSLYLSSQLQYGVVVVFHRQCVIFLKELQYIVGQLLKKSRSKGLDMKDPGRQMTLFTDPMARLDEIDGGLDPLFGEMDEFRPSPSVLMQEIPEQGAFSAEIQPLTPARSASPINRITASREQITMNDLELIFAPEFSGQDLDDNVEDTLEVLLAQTDNFLTELLRPEAAPAAEAEVERAPVREPSPATATTATALTVGPTTVSSQEQDLTLHPQDETQGMPQSLAEEMTPVGTLPPVSSSATDAAQESAVAEGAPHPEETEPKRKKKRAAGRQLIFFDPLTQIPHDKLQQQIRDPLLETRIRPFLPPESHRLKSARELLSQPCGGQFRSDPLPSCTRWTRRGPITALPEDLLLLWTQSSTITPIDDAQLLPSGGGVESSSSEESRPVEPDGSPAEVPRDGTEAEAVQVSGLGSLPLEASEQRESSREISPVYPPEQESWSRSGVKLPDLAEVPEALPESVGPEEKALLFHALLPPEADRRSVSNLFQNLLDILATGKIRADQVEPYGHIVLQRGPNYDEETFHL
ncbi:meiotic recombination protein REC8 homolog isoform X3 [Vanacampus margaritifer]